MNFIFWRYIVNKYISKNDLLTDAVTVKLTQHRQSISDQFAGGTA